ncbi:hypothetical protein [Georgenia sp. SUBG003]|uniref:hypothetical protein n=1 Tax=Georgenia sp. SUBG003 TaxID=1497974 RepID=UPI003AB13135
MLDVPRGHPGHPPLTRPVALLGWLARREAGVLAFAVALGIGRRRTSARSWPASVVTRARLWCTEEFESSSVLSSTDRAAASITARRSTGSSSASVNSQRPAGRADRTSGRWSVVGGVRSGSWSVRIFRSTIRGRAARGLT